MGDEVITPSTTTSISAHSGVYMCKLSLQPPILEARVKYDIPCG